MKIQSSARFGFLLALVSPIMAIHFAIQNLKWDQRKYVLIFVITLFGGSIILKTSDGYVLQQMIYDHYVGLSFDRWFYELKEMLLFNPPPDTKGDVYSHFTSYLMGEVLGLPGQYFVLVSLIYGYFYVSALSKILQWDSSHAKSNLFWLLIIIFITYRFVDELQTVRTWTGLWVLFNGVFDYHKTGKLKYLLLILAAPLFHLAYFIIAIPALVVVFIKWVSPKFFVLVYALSFFIQVNSGEVIEQLQTTELGEQKVAGYYREDTDEYLGPLQDKSANWYKKYGKGWSLPNAPHVLAISLILMGVYSNRKMNKLEVGLFSTGILMAVLANLGDFIPPFYTRTMINAGIYIIATVVLLLLRGELLNANGWPLRGRKLLLWNSAFSFFPYMVYVASNMLQFTSIFMITLPFLGFSPEFNISIRELIGYIF